MGTSSAFSLGTQSRICLAPVVLCQHLDGGSLVVNGLRTRPVTGGGSLFSHSFSVVMMRAAGRRSGIPSDQGVICGAIRLHANFCSVLWVKLVGADTRHRIRLILRSEGPSIQIGAVAARMSQRLFGRTRMEGDTSIQPGQCRVGGAFNAPLAGANHVLPWKSCTQFSGIVLAPAMAAV